MASLTVRNLVEGLKRRLRVRAAEIGRSMEQEAREILRSALGSPEVSSRIRWERESPPDEAYGRVTDSGRFEPLHSAAIEMIARLEADFEVERVEAYGLDDELEGPLTCARPSVKLSPVDPAAAPITVTFSDYPGLHIRFGRWSTQLFPVCGCDACDESAEDEIERLTMMVDSVTTGGFREAVQPSVEDGWLKTEFWTPGYGGKSSGSSVGWARALRMSGGRRRLELDWKPWPRRRAANDPQPFPAR